MGLTTGTIMFAVGIAGAITFTILLLIMIPVFHKQRKRMLDLIGR